MSVATEPALKNERVASAAKTPRPIPNPEAVALGDVGPRETADDAFEAAEVAAQEAADAPLLATDAARAAWKKNLTARAQQVRRDLWDPVPAAAPSSQDGEDHKTSDGPVSSPAATTTPAPENR